MLHKTAALGTCLSPRVFFQPAMNPEVILHRRAPACFRFFFEACEF
jgi:hypothetical protein